MPYHTVYQYLRTAVATHIDTQGYIDNTDTTGTNFRLDFLRIKKGTHNESGDLFERARRHISYHDISYS